MSKRNSDGDVLANKLSLGLANRQKLLASLMGPPEDDPATTDASKNEKDDAELEDASFGHDRLGVGGIPPKDVAQGLLAKRNTISNDKLLEQLIGKKKAKAHLANKQQAERAGAQPQQVPKNGRRQVVKKEESEDEEEGRAATFKSKRRKVGQQKQTPLSDEGMEGDEDAAGGPITEEPEEEAGPSVVQKDDGDSDVPPVKTKPKSLPSRGRAKPTSYLDELLAERSKKEKNKAKNKAKNKSVAEA